VWENDFYRPSALPSWWIAPWIPLFRNGLNCVPICYFLVEEMHVVNYLDLWLLEFDQQVSSQELFLVVL
jgi:hypothetical protein